MKNSRSTPEDVRKAVMAALDEDDEAEVELSWTAEEWLGEMKRRGEISHFKQVPGWEDGNIRKYKVWRK